MWSFHTIALWWRFYRYIHNTHFRDKIFANSRVVYWTLESLWPRLTDMVARESCVVVLTFPRLATSLSFHHCIGNSYDSTRHIIKLQFITIAAQINSCDRIMLLLSCFDDMMARAGQHTAKSLTFCQFNRIRILNAFELFFTSSTIYGNYGKGWWRHDEMASRKQFGFRPRKAISPCSHHHHRNEIIGRLVRRHSSFSLWQSIRSNLANACHASISILFFDPLFFPTLFFCSFYREKSIVQHLTILLLDPFTSNS